MARPALLGALLCALRLGSGHPDPEDSVPAAPRGCPEECLCAADLLSCAGLGLRAVPTRLPATATHVDLSHNELQRLRPGWLGPLRRLQALRLAHNQLDVLGRGVFANASGLRRLDLSSNGLRALGRHDLEGLARLRELLLFNNSLARLHERAFLGLDLLGSLYLGHNDLEAFSFLHLHGLGIRHLRTLDLSFNHLERLPVPDLAALPAFLKAGLYLHGNPLRCECPLYHLLRGWQQRGLGAVSSFAREYVCLAFGVPSSGVRFFEHGRIFENCSAAPAPGLEQPEEHLQVQVGQPLQLHCNASAPAVGIAWVSPQQELLVPPGYVNRSIVVLANGSLTIKHVQPWHEGIFVCLATGPHLPRNQTHEYNVSVRFPHPEPETFKTSFTTLLGCVVGLVLVLLYLFAPPCPGCRRCYQRAGRCCRCWPRTPSLLQELSVQSSVLSTTPPDTLSRKASVHKHVVFLEPGRRGLNGRVQLAVAEDFDLYNPAGLRLKAGLESASSTGSETVVMT